MKRRMITFIGVRLSARCDFVPPPRLFHYLECFKGLEVRLGLEVSSGDGFCLRLHVAGLTSSALIDAGLSKTLILFPQA